MFDSPSPGSVTTPVRCVVRTTAPLMRVIVAFCNPIASAATNGPIPRGSTPSRSSRATTASRIASTVNGNEKRDRRPTRRAPSVINPLANAPAPNAATSPAKWTAPVAP